MSLIRNPAVYTGAPLHNSIPAAGSAFWYRLRDSVDTSGIEGIPPLAKTGTPSGSEYADPTMYTLPLDNGASAPIQFIAQEDATDLFLNRVLTMVGMTAGEQIIVAMDLSYIEQATTNGTLWTWGVNSAHSVVGFNITSGEIPQLNYKPRNGSTYTSTALTFGTGSNFAAFKSVGRFACVMGFRVLDATHVDVTMRIGNGTLTGNYTLSNVDMRLDGTANPGISGGSSMSTFVGLSIGSAGVTGGPNTSFFGRGGTNTAKLDNVIGWRGTYAAGRTAAVLNEMAVTHKLDFPPSLRVGA